MDLPKSLSKSRADLEKLEKSELIELVMSTNLFLLEQILNENSNLKKKMDILQAVIAGHSNCLEDITTRLSVVEIQETNVLVNEYYV